MPKVIKAAKFEAAIPDATAKAKRVRALLDDADIMVRARDRHAASLVADVKPVEARRRPWQGLRIADWPKHVDPAWFMMPPLRDHIADRRGGGGRGGSIPPIIGQAVRDAGIQQAQIMQLVRDAVPERKPMATDDDIEHAIMALDAMRPALAFMWKGVRGEALAEGVKAVAKTFLVNDGWRYAGEGYFSQVYVRKGVALKVNLREDAGGMYAAWARQNQGKPGVPTIYELQRIGRGYAILMPEYFEAVNALSRVSTGWGAIDVMAYPAGVERDYADVFMVMRGSQPVTDVGRAMHELYTFFSGAAGFDIHKANVMLDHDGKLIITDPLSNSTQQKVKF
jgi:hypothetical protein